ncbi:MAG TPA: proliferating cell nuclear antigen (pcna) [Desulfurococcales archaeon]|nr:proliferating cell nuclear antigen (pcna) [Desulfurococcales archaeon]
MVKLTFYDARVWKYIIGSIKKIITEGVFVVNEEGLHMRTMDSSHIAMIDIYVPSTAFEEFEVEGESSIGVNFDELSKIMRRATKGEKLTLSVDEGKLSIIFTGKMVREFKLPMLDISSEKLPEPKVKFNVTARMQSSIFRDMIKDLEPIGEAVTFNAEENKLKVKASSERGIAEVILDVESGALLDLNIKEPSIATYSLDYLKDISGVAQAVDIVVLNYSSNMPLKLDFEIPNGGRVTLYLAPRVE